MGSYESPRPLPRTYGWRLRIRYAWGWWDSLLWGNILFFVTITVEKLLSKIMSIRIINGLFSTPWTFIVLIHSWAFNFMHIPLFTQYSRSLSCILGNDGEVRWFLFIKINAHRIRHRSKGILARSSHRWSQTRANEIFLGSIDGDSGPKADRVNASLIFDDDILYVSTYRWINSR